MLLCAVGVLLPWSTASAQADTDPKPAQKAPDREQILAEAEQIDDKVGQIRGLVPLGPITKSIKTKDELRAELQKRIAEEIPPEDIAREARVLVRLGLIEADFDYGGFFLDLFTEQIAGFYNDEARELALIEGDMSMDEQRVVMAHELFHAIQDQHYTIASIQPPKEGLAGLSNNEDRATARSALIEGDATVLMVDFMVYEMGGLQYGSGASVLDNPMAASLIDGMAAQSGGSMAGSSPVLGNAPGWIQEQLIFPYMGGLKFVAAMRKNQSWGPMANVYQSPPDSTEQILHPEKYLERDEPTLIALDEAALTEALGGELIYNNVMGELRVRQWLTHHADDETLPRLLKRPGLTGAVAAAGWDGDRYYGIDTPQGKTAIIGASVWDSEEDAKEFAAALGAIMQARYPKAERHDQSGEHGASMCLEGSDERQYVEQWGTWVIFMDGIPSDDPALLNNLRQIIWDSRRAGPYPPTKTAGPLPQPGSEQP